MAKQMTSENDPKQEEKKQRTALYILPSAQQKVKFICLKDGRFQNDVFEEAIQDYIERWEKKNGAIKI